MEAFLPDTVKVVLVGLMAFAFVLNRLARALPHVAWLQVFRLPVLHLSDEQKAARRRAGNRTAAVELILLGLALPLLYVASTVMLFNDIKTSAMVLVGGCSVICVGLGIWLLVRNR